MTLSLHASGITKLEAPTQTTGRGHRATGMWKWAGLCCAGVPPNPLTDLWDALARTPAAEKLVTGEISGTRWPTSELRRNVRTRRRLSLLTLIALARALDVKPAKLIEPIR